MITQGRTVDEALANLKEALALYIDDDGPHDTPAYPPIIAPVEVEIRS